MLSCTLTTALTAGLAFASQAAGLNIMLNNDDGFGSANIREIYRLLKGDGHNVVIVAPAVQQSGQGGRSVFTDEANLTAPSQYNLVGAGEPSLGQDPIDPGIWYYNVSRQNEMPWKQDLTSLRELRLLALLSDSTGSFRMRPI